MSAVRLPEQLAAAARDVLEGRTPAVTPRDAATVMLLRPAGGESAGFEVYMLRRKASMAFAPGAYVFPGGAVDARDADEQTAWAGPRAAWWAQQLAAPPELARALVCAAVRETFEESGVLLAGPSAAELVPDTTGDDWETDRRRLLDRSVSLAELLASRGLVLRSDLLRPWAHWITPVIESRRYDTRFFAAALPAGQLTRDVGGEAAEVQWISPAAALELARNRQIQLWLPTAVTLAELTDHADAPGVLGAVRKLEPLLPEIELEGEKAWLTVPGGREYPL
jgi:8-oxo-dGTP pyrophosphatase MutT (NUDIX family)